MPRFLNLLPGDPAPIFHQRSLTNPNYAFDTAAGRYIVMCFFGSMSNAHAQAAISAADAWTDLFDDNFACFFGVSADPSDETKNRLQDRYPGKRHFLDFDRSVSRLYGAAAVHEANGPASNAFNQRWVIVSPGLRVMGVIPFAPDRSDIIRARSFLDALPQPELSCGTAIQAPILYMPQVFERDLCDRLIRLYTSSGGEESGFMREVGGITKVVHDHSHKRRRDHVIDDPDLISTLQERVKRRIVPEIRKVHQFDVTRMERYLVACYSAEDRGHFRPHRDNKTKGTAHRRFAVTINLSEDFEGGELYFPECSKQAFKPPIGGAVVFSCSLLHAVSPVTRGERFAFLPFLYDEDAAEIRRQNNLTLMRLSKNTRAKSPRAIATSKNDCVFQI